MIQKKSPADARPEVCALAFGEALPRAGLDCLTTGLGQADRARMQKDRSQNKKEN